MSSITATATAAIAICPIWLTKGCCPDFLQCLDASHRLKAGVSQGRHISTLTALNRPKVWPRSGLSGY